MIEVSARPVSLEAGAFADNQRVNIHAYLVDQAGNLGGATENAAESVSF